MAEREVGKALKADDPLSSIRMYALLNLLITIGLAATLYLHLTAEAGAGGFVARPEISDDEIGDLLRQLNISLSAGQSRALAGSLNDLLGLAVERSSAGGVITTTTTEAAGPLGEAGAGNATVSVSVDGSTIDVIVTASCGTYNETPPSCTPTEEACQPYGTSCGDGLECCDPYSCIDGQCGFPTTPPPPQTCQSYSTACNVTSDCCDPYSCVSGYCDFPTTPPPPPPCQTSGPCTNSSQCCSPYVCLPSGFCNIPLPTCVEEGQSCGPNDTCCEDLVCDDTTDTCQPPPTCIQENVSCDSSSECCGNLQCLQGACKPPPPPPPTCQTSGTCQVDSDCCDPYSCISGTCNLPPPPPPQELCSETDNGADYFNLGTTTGSLSGAWGSYTDYCTNPNVVNEYYCVVIYGYDAQGMPTTTRTSNVTQTTLTCTSGCSNGECI